METEDGVTLSGTTGSGKTHLAVYYGYEFHKNHPTSTVWMMRSKDQASLQMSMTKLANKLDILTGKTKDTENPINELGRMIAHVLLEKTTEKPHIIIFDDVDELCQKIVEGLIKMFVPMKKSHGSIKFIVTTMDTLLKMPKIPRTKRISVDGFTEEEATSFLSGNQTCEMSETDALKNLALSMSRLPLGLSCAKTYMTNCSKSGKAFLKLLKANTLKKLDCNLKQHDASKRSLFSNLDTLIRIMEKDLDKDATEMFKMTQFLESENIPTILFELMSTSSGINIGDLDKDIENDVETCNSVSTDSLVQAVQKFSFGTVQGIDDKRIIHTHTAVSLTLGAFTDENTKMRLLKRLLWTFALILDKDNRNQEDHNLMVSVLPQAKSVLLHAMNMMKDDLETYLLIAFVNDLVAYISNFEGLLALEKYHSEKSLDYWYKVMETTEKEMNEGLSYKKQLCTTYVEHREFARAKAIVIDKKLTTLRQRYEQKIDGFIGHFILQRRRTRADVKLLSKYLENYEEEALTMPQYRILCEKERAVPLENMTDTFIKEMILYTFYTYGRRIFYIGKCCRDGRETQILSLLVSCCPTRRDPAKKFSTVLTTVLFACSEERHPRVDF
ncbi:uncharacterized protein LOC117333092 [Pecten maximus]|uniref:uncharacterized protein LOC117333092 n=1 Tax=Pecten maximus TaxID=6579 RepID=UPI001458C0EE|nr:uncharacterized protein LOC117333092 [Pecten maximus]XP_033748115.1 uncharacterized protein LOC117333092 [Pecten maximus]